MTNPRFSYQACFVCGDYRRHLTISQIGNRWFASKLNDNGSSSLLSITLYGTDSHDELISIITGGVQ